MTTQTKNADAQVHCINIDQIVHALVAAIYDLDDSPATSLAIALVGGIESLNADVLRYLERAELSEKDPTNAGG